MVFKKYNKDMDRAKKAADARIKPFQKSLTFGDHFIRFISEEDADEPFVIYHRVVELSEIDKSYRGSVRREMKEGSFVFCRAFSVMELEGELGSVHRSTVDIPITPEQFKAFEQAEWPTDLDAVRYILGNSAKTPGSA